MKNFIKNLDDKHLGYIIFGISFLGMTGSLFFSEVMKLPPCVLCWYQRVALYPMVVLSMVGIIRADKNMPISILSLSIPGLLISLYHNVVYWKFVPDGFSPCAEGVSCTTKYFEWFGFITLPFLSLLAFLVITIVAFYMIKKSKKETISNN